MELTNEFTVGVPLDEAWAILTDVERIAPCMPGAQLQEVEGDEYRGVVKVKVGPITAQYKGVASFIEQEAPTRAVLRAEGREARGQGRATATITALLAGEADSTTVTLTTDLAITGKVAQFGRSMLADVSGALVDQFVECLGSKLLASDEVAATDAGIADGAGGSDDPADDATPTSAVVSATAAAGADTSDAGDGDGGTDPDGGAAGGSPSGTPAAGSPSATAGEAAPAAPRVRRIDAPEPTPVDLLATGGTPVAKRLAPVAAALAALWLIRLFLRRRR